jgi:hypothetical protein
MRWQKNAIKTAEAFSRQACRDKLCEVYRSVIQGRVGAEEEDQHKISSWDSLLETIMAEWDLASQKMRAALSAVANESVK